MGFASKQGRKAALLMIALAVCARCVSESTQPQDSVEPAPQTVPATRSAGQAPSEAQPGTPPPDPLSESELLRKAETIVEEYTADKQVWARGFGCGLRVIGMSIEKAEESAASDEVVQMDEVLPEWLSPAQLMGTVPQGSRVNVRLLWKVEPTPNAPVDGHEFSVRLAHHDGYTERSQESERRGVRLSEHPFGTVFWTDHAFAPLTNSAPGLYDVYVTSMALPVETIPLGQILVTGWVESSRNVETKIASLFPGSIKVFGGQAVLSKWFSYRFPIFDLAAAPKTLIVVSSVDWIEDEEDLTDVGRLTVRYASGRTEERQIKLGRDTASTWYNLHARGVVKHQLAPVAWSSRVRRDTVDFDANVYAARFELDGGSDLPSSVEIAYAADRGILRLRGLALEP